MEPIVGRKYNVCVFQEVFRLENIDDVLHHIVNREQRSPPLIVINTSIN